jgi:hypothetical protein
MLYKFIRFNRLNLNKMVFAISLYLMDICKMDLLLFGLNVIVTNILEFEYMLYNNNEQIRSKEMQASWMPKVL